MNTVCYELTPENFDRELNGLFEAMTELNLQEGYILNNGLAGTACKSG